ncbi:MAG: arsenate reductase ArsC [Candidatus Altarchaeaceae archaeon]
MLKKKIAFVCIENSCRSQIAEALAKKYCDNLYIEFLSMGSHPAKEVDKNAIEVLKEEGIEWKGKPKVISTKEHIDVIVTMGCGVECPIIPNVKRIEWNIAVPKGKGIEEYRKIKNIIKEKVIELIELIKQEKL